MVIGPAFYKKTDDGELVYGPNAVHAPGFTLLKEKRETYNYPVDGWYWFDSEAEAREFLGVPEVDKNEKEGLMNDGMVPVLVKNNRDELEIKMVSFGTVPSGMITTLPFGFGPADLRFIKYERGNIQIDLEGKLSGASSGGKDLAQAILDWNEKSIVERFSEAYFGRG
jgi:hypothetical protein